MSHTKRYLAGIFFAFGISSAVAETPPSEKNLFRSIYQELIEINTSHSAGSTTQAAEALKKHLLNAGFAGSDIQIFEPFPKKGNLVLRYKGDGSAKPLLLLAHIDVVEAKREDWQTDPFKLQEKDGVFTARGAIDDKAMAAAFVSVLAQLKREGYLPKRDIILALTADEERSDLGSNGAEWLLANRRELVDAEFGINEGGRGELKNGKPYLHTVQIGEKLFASYQFKATGPGGHSARPTRDNTIYDLAEALTRLRQYQFPVNLTPASRVYFERTGKLEQSATAEDMLAVAKGMGGADAAADRLSALPHIVGLLRTTCVATMLQAGHAPNSLAQSATATINCRLLPDDDFNFVQEKLREIAGNKVKVEVIRRDERAPGSPMRADLMGHIERLTEQMWPGVPVIPTLGVSTTDSRRFRSVGIPMYGVSGLFVDPANTGVHGLNEHIVVQQLYDGREFLYRLVKSLGTSSN